MYMLSRVVAEAETKTGHMTRAEAEAEAETGRMTEYPARPKPNAKMSRRAIATKFSKS